LSFCFKDDDIDEDELDKLTALVEDDTQRQADRVLKEVQPSFVEVRKPDNCTPRQSSTKSDKQAALASDIPCHNKCEMSVTNGLRAETVHVPKIGAVLSGSAISSGTEADVLVKLSKAVQSFMSSLSRNAMLESFSLYIMKCNSYSPIINSV